MIEGRNLYDITDTQVVHHFEPGPEGQRHVQEGTMNYIVKDGKVIIIDEFTAGCGGRAALSLNSLARALEQGGCQTWRSQETSPRSRSRTISDDCTRSCRKGGGRAGVYNMYNMNVVNP